MSKNLWLLPAAASVLFFVFTLQVVINEGLFGFVANHSRNGWGAQVFIDLVSAATLALCFAAPHARKYGIKLLPWIALTVCTGSIGLFALAARILYVRENSLRKVNDYRQAATSQVHIA
jgi:hypothetical protein